MKADWITKILLAVVALALWANVLKRPWRVEQTHAAAPVQQQAFDPAKDFRPIKVMPCSDECDKNKQGLEICMASFPGGDDWKAECRKSWQKRIRESCGL